MATASIKDVAAAAGVAVGTVSNVLNRPEAVRASTRERVEAAIDELGFVRNDSARQLRAGSSRTIAYLVLDAANPFFTDVYRGIDEAARAEGLCVFLCDSGQDARREDEYLEQLLQQRVRGVCITPVDAHSARLAELVAREMPVVMVDNSPDDVGTQWCSVGVDDVFGGELAAAHLLERGHTRIAYAGSPALAQSVDRLAGARRAGADAGLSLDALTVLDTDGMGVGDGRLAAARVLGVPARRRPTAIFCGNDLIALGALQELTQRGVDVPGEVAIVGYDDIDFAAAAAVPLTSVSQPRHRLGRAALKLLLQETGSAHGHVHRHERFEPELVVRAST